MKRTPLFISFILMLSACSKSDKGGNPSGGTGLTATISTQMAKTDSLSSFNKYFKANTLSDADISGGITVLAPSNNAFGNASVSGSGQLPDASVLKDYIVKGVLKPSDFTKGKTLTTLSGKTLTVSVVVDPIILVNGMIINTSAISSADNYVVYGAAQLLNAPAPIFITVWDATKWSSAKPKGEPSVGATVKLYKTQAAFADNQSPDYTGTTDKDGVAQINGVNPGAYYVSAGNGIYSNIFSVYTEKVKGVLVGYAADTVLDNAGNFIWKDINSDGKIDKNDQTAQPALSIQTEKDKPLEISVLIGSFYKLPSSINDVQTKLDNVYMGLSTFYQNLVIMDGTLSDDAGCNAGSGSSYCPLDVFNITANMPVFNTIWNDAYFKGIHKLNEVVYDLGAIAGQASQSADIAAQAAALRDYIYLELLTYFGDVPVSNNDMSADFYPDILRTQAGQVFTAIEADLVNAANALPATRADGKLALTSYAAKALLAKAALQQKDYNKVLTYTSQIMSSSAFTLAPAGYSWLTSQNTNETIWAPTFSNIGTPASWYFAGAYGATTLQWCPVLRYVDVLLMDAEAKIALANYPGAVQDLNLLRLRNSQGTVSFNNATDGMTALQDTWKVEKSRQGDRYASLLRWGNAQQVLGANWHPFNNLMPIPQTFIAAYIGLKQNPAY
ncbi:MAG: RagB/SusD family nutrient uptake outer membrane protein [Chitinophagaceae bacterium]|nr:RagB/SusD family nutrient uptake outer membrane protein [Chitinophagaceae bacterium]